MQLHSAMNRLCCEAGKMYRLEIKSPADQGEVSGAGERKLGE